MDLRPLLVLEYLDWELKPLESQFDAAAVAAPAAASSAVGSTAVAVALKLEHATPAVGIRDAAANTAGILPYLRWHSRSKTKTCP